MSRVERTETPNERREPSRHAERGRTDKAPQRSPGARTTPGKAEGELDDVEEALRREER